MIRELNARSIYEGEKKKELQDLLKDELHGVQRVPALLFTSPNKTLESINCVGYEHIIGNVFIRVQAEKELKAEQPSTSDTQEAFVSKLASSLPNFGNSKKLQTLASSS